MTENAPWRCVNCRQLRKHSASYCQTCHQPWQSVIDRTYVHNPGGRQQTYSSDWTYDPSGWHQYQTPQEGQRTRSKSRAKTPRGRRSKSASFRNSQPGDGKGQGKSYGKTMPPMPPLPPPATPWVGYGVPTPPMMMMPPQQASQQILHPPLHPAPHQPPQISQPLAPVAPAFNAGHSTATLDPEHREVLEMVRSRQAELPADMRQKVQKMEKKAGAQATKDLHSAVRNLGFARKDVEEAMQARCNMISSWKTFLTDAVKTWQEYATLFQAQERDLQERIQQAQAAFAQAKQQAEQSQEEAGKITAIEIKDDEEEIEGETSHAELTSGKIHEGMLNLTASLQTLQAQAAAIEIEEKSAKRPRTSSPTVEDSKMAEESAAPPKGSAASHFVSPGCA